jgi:4-amino-4-deoxy-L-arabinose transferase-like glycosyltransferase
MPTRLTKADVGATIRSGLTPSSAIEMIATGSLLQLHAAGPATRMEKMDRNERTEARVDKPALFDKKKQLLYWAGALILTVAVRSYLFTHDYTINGDGIRYVTAGRSFWHGLWAEGLSSFYPPFFPLLIAAAYPLTGEWELAGRFWPFILGILMVFPLFAVLRGTYSPKVAWAAMFFYGVSPYLARFSVDVRSEVPYTFFFLLSVYFFLKGLDTSSLPPFFLTGLSASLAYLIRPEGIGLVMVAVAYLCYRPWRKQAAKKICLQATLLCLGFALFAVPYVLYLRGNTGSWTISRKAANVVSYGMTHYDKSLESVRRENSAQISAIDVVLSRPLVYAKKVFIDGFRTLDTYAVALHYSAVPFLLIGWYLCFRSRFWRARDFPLILFIVFYFAVFSLFYPSRRFTIPLVPISLGWVALGFLSVQEYCRSSWPGRKADTVAGLILLLFCVATLPKTLKAADRDKIYVRDAAAYLKGKPGNPFILSTNPQVAFYADGNNRILRVRPDLFLSRLASTTPDFLVLDRELFEDAEEGLKRQGWSVDRAFLGQRDGIYVLH